VVYDPQAPAELRFSTAGMPNSTIPRLYHSTATLLPYVTCYADVRELVVDRIYYSDGRIMIAGSNPNDDVSTRTYETEYRELNTPRFPRYH
jgi:hypothetical protein